MSLCSHGDGIARKPAEAGAAAARGLAGALDGLEAAHELADRHLGLHPRQRKAGAGVDAEAERQMAVGMAADVEPVRLGELRRDRGWRRRCTDARRCRPASRCRRCWCPRRRGGCRAGSSFPSAGIPRPRCRSPRDGRRGRACASGWRSSRSTALPIRLVVVSWPALSRKMQLCSSSSSDSRSPFVCRRIRWRRSGSKGFRRSIARLPSGGARRGRADRP